MCDRRRLCCQSKSQPIVLFAIFRDIAMLCRDLCMAISLIAFHVFLTEGRSLATTLMYTPPCVNHERCGLNRFCLRPSFSQLPGTCQHCWRCCLFPEAFGRCPESCLCSVGTPCNDETTCGEGLFCANSLALDKPTCQMCSKCTNNSIAVSGSCSSMCASGVWNATEQSRNAAINAQHLYLAFLADELAGGTETISSSQLDVWYRSEHVFGIDGRAELLAAVSNPMNASEISKEAWTTSLQNKYSTSLVCPTNSMLSPYTPHQHSLSHQVVPPGCPCNATQNAGAYKCMAGYRCSKTAYKGMTTDLAQNSAAIRMAAICVSCRLGDFCAEGTFIEDEADLSSLACPSGQYCESPATSSPCPSGAYCVAGTFKPTTCDYQALMDENPETLMPSRARSVLQRLLVDGDPQSGNFCPMGASTPNNICREGYYCPNASVQIVCPSRHFCKAQSIEPRRCPILTPCSPGTVSPRYSHLVFIITLLFMMALPISWLIMTHVDMAITSSLSTDRLVAEQVCRTRTFRATTRIIKSWTGNAYGCKHDTSLHQAGNYKGYRQIEVPLKLEFDMICVRMKAAPQECILRNVSGCFSPGRTNAILGPSGCGKTTLLNVLGGKSVYGVTTGRIVVNNIEGLGLASLRSITGFVPQDDIVHEDLTVRECLSYSAHMKLPATMESNVKREIINDAMAMLALQPIGQCRVGSVEKRGISGGQRKRVNIGMELVASPSILFMDEPTSGLDSTSSHEIVLSLSDLAKLGMSVIAVIHQPRFSSFLLFDQVMLLGNMGSTVYMGPPSHALPWFQALCFSFPAHENVADILLDIVAGKIPRWQSVNKSIDSGFRPAKLPLWWERFGSSWLKHLRDVDAPHQPLFDADADVIQTLGDKFDRIDQERHGGMRTGQLDATAVLELLAILGHQCSLEEVLCWVRQLNSKPKPKSHVWTDAMVLSKNLLLNAVIGQPQPHHTSGMMTRVAEQESLQPTTARLFEHASCDSLDLTFGLQQSTPSKHMDKNLGPAVPPCEMRDVTGSVQSAALTTDILLDPAADCLAQCNISTPATSQLIRDLIAIPPEHDGNFGDATQMSTKSKDIFILRMLVEALDSRPQVGLISQVSILLQRCMIKYVRSFWPTRIMDCVLLMIAAWIIGCIHGTNWGVESVPSHAVMAMTGLGVLSMIAHLRTFSHDWNLVQRETQGGMSMFAYFMAQTLFDITWIIVAPILYLVPYYYLTLPAMPFASFYAVAILVCWWASGMAYMICAIFPSSAQLMAGVFVALTFGAFVEGLSPTLASQRGGLLEVMLGFSYNRWAMELISIAEFKMYGDNMRNTILRVASGIGICRLDSLAISSDGLASSILYLVEIQEQPIMSQCKQPIQVAYSALFCLGMGYRILAYVCLYIFVAK